MSKILYIALWILCVAGFLSIPYQVVERITLPAPANRSESPYFIAPGNRSPCDLWVAHQSDSSLAKWIVKCVGEEK